MKLSRNKLRKIVLKELKLITEGTVMNARSAIQKAATSVELKGSGATDSQRGIANIINELAGRYIHKEKISDEDAAAMKKYIDSVSKNYFKN